MNLALLSFTVLPSLSRTSFHLIVFSTFSFSLKYIQVIIIDLNKISNTKGFEKIIENYKQVMNDTECYIKVIICQIEPIYLYGISLTMGIIQIKRT